MAMFKKHHNLKIILILILLIFCLNTSVYGIVGVHKCHLRPKLLTDSKHHDKRIEDALNIASDIEILSTWKVISLIRENVDGDTLEAIRNELLSRAERNPDSTAIIGLLVRALTDFAPEYAEFIENILLEISEIINPRNNKSSFSYGSVWKNIK